MAVSKCELVINGTVKHKGRASIEFYHDAKPVYFCMGYWNQYYDNYCDECLRCSMHVDKAQSELDRFRRE